MARLDSVPGAKGFARARVGWKEGGLSGRTDDQLVVDFVRGDEEALRILVQRWEGPVYAFLVHMMGSTEDAEDLCQDTFMRLIQAARRYQPAGKFRSWLLRIAGNLARSRLRRRKILRWVPLGPEHDVRHVPARDPLAALVDRQEQQRVQAAIQRLPDRQREALILKQFHGLAYREIAEAMGASVASVQMLLHRAMTALRGELGEEP